MVEGEWSVSCQPSPLLRCKDETEPNEVFAIYRKQLRQWKNKRVLAAKNKIGSGDQEIPVIQASDTRGR